MKAMDIAQLVYVLAPFGITTVEGIISALRGGGVSDDKIDTDLRALISDALLAKAEADRAATGQDPR